VAKVTTFIERPWLFVLYQDGKNACQQKSNKKTKNKKDRSLSQTCIWASRHHRRCRVDPDGA
jgi:hypothetical protein